MFGGNYFGQPYFGQGYAGALAGTVHTLILSSASSLSAAIRKQVGKSTISVSANAPSLARLVGKGFYLSSTASPSSSTPSLAVLKNVTGSSPTASSVTKAISKAISTPPSAVLASLVASFIPKVVTHLLTLAASSTSSAALQRAIIRVFPVTQPSVSQIVRLTDHTLSPSPSSSALTLTKGTLKSLTATPRSIPSFVRFINATRGITILTRPALQRTVRTGLSAVSSSLAYLIAAKINPSAPIPVKALSLIVSSCKVLTQNLQTTNKTRISIPSSQIETVTGLRFGVSTITETLIADSQDQALYVDNEDQLVVLGSEDVGAYVGPDSVKIL